MAFDINTARPVSGFDLSTARPVAEDPGDTPEKRQRRKQFMEQYYRQMNENLTGMDRFMVGAGRGMTTIGRGLGLVEPEDPQTKAAADALAKESMTAAAGEIVGEAAPFAVFGPIVGAARSLAARMAMSGGLGALEGFSIVKGKGGDITDAYKGAGTGAAIGAAAEALIPVVGRLGNQVFRKLKRKPKGPLLRANGEPTQELLDALEEAGTSFNELTDDAVEFIMENQRTLTDPAEIARRARFEEQGIPYTKGDISQDFAQQASEERLISMATAEHGEPLRQFRLDQSRALENKIDQLVTDLGVPDRAGTKIKSALKGRKKLLMKEKNALYRKAGESAPELNMIPLMTDTLLEALPDRQTLRQLERIQGSQIKPLRDLLVEFGIDQSPDAVASFGEEITPLTLGNLENFRAAVNMLTRADTTGATSVAAKGIITALDGEADILAKSLKDAGIDIGEEALEALKGARKTVRQVKTEFSPQSITGRLVDVKRDGVTPVLEASRVVKELSSKPVEQLDRTIKSLSRSGKKGRTAINDMRAAVVLNAFEDALRAPSRKTSGIQTMSGNMFHRSLKKFGDDRLDVLFRGDPGMLKRLRQLEQIGVDIQPTAGAMPRGSAPVILDLMNRAGRVPFIGEVVNFARLIIKAGADERAVAKALEAKPSMRRVANVLSEEFPALATALGVTMVVQPEEEQ